MRCIAGFLCVCALGVVALSQSVSAQAGEEGTSAKPNTEEPVQSTEPTRSRLERWHPEAFDDPSKPTSTPVYVDPVTGAPLAVPEDSQVPTAPPTKESKRKGRRIGIGVGVSVAVVVVVAVLVGMAAGLR
jgi:hypothetical protein